MGGKNARLCVSIVGGDIDGLYSDDSEDEPKTCPECGGVMKFAMLSDSVGNGLHGGHECTDCGHAE